MQFKKNVQFCTKILTCTNDLVEGEIIALCHLCNYLLILPLSTSLIVGDCHRFHLQSSPDQILTAAQLMIPLWVSQVRQTESIHSIMLTVGCGKIFSTAVFLDLKMRVCCVNRHQWKPPTDNNKSAQLQIETMLSTEQLRYTQKQN